MSEGKGCAGKQIIVSARVKETHEQTEMLVLEFSLDDLLKLVGTAQGDGSTPEPGQRVLVLANIPEEGRSRAPAYVKVLEPRR